MPFFSVVITVYNKGEFIKNTINSVLNQSFQDFEVIVVNDGSTDESKNIIESFNDKRIHLITTKNQGVSAARNTGIGIANAGYIGLLDGDDLWDKDFLKFIKEAITEFPDISVFSTALAHRYRDKVIPATYNFEQTKTNCIHNFFKSSLDHTILTSSSIVFNKIILEKTGYFDTSIESGEDTDFWIRIGMHYKIVFINKILAHYNFVPESISNTVFSVKNKPKYDKYFKEEQKDKHLKIYIDRNRFPLAILSKLERNKESFKFYRNHINPDNLRFSQKIILISPRWFIRLLLRIKSLKGEKLYYPLT
ncbi:MAG: glycosyltransferase family 2 protein [Winogradskyella sp.]|jgi:glycosyltransferase involved in cell wall biosynthesis